MTTEKDVQEKVLQINNFNDRLHQLTISAQYMQCDMSFKKIQPWEQQHRISCAVNRAYHEAILLASFLSDHQDDASTIKLDSLQRALLENIDDKKTGKTYTLVEMKQ